MNGRRSSAPYKYLTRSVCGQARSILASLGRRLQHRAAPLVARLSYPVCVRCRTRKATGEVKPRPLLHCAHARQHPSVSGRSWKKDRGHVRSTLSTASTPHLQTVGPSRSYEHQFIIAINALTAEGRTFKGETPTQRNAALRPAVRGASVSPYHPPGSYADCGARARQMKASNAVKTAERAGVRKG